MSNNNALSEVKLTAHLIEDLIKKNSRSGDFDGKSARYYKIQQFEKDIGVSIFRHYEKDLSFNPSLYPDGTSADVCMIRLGVDPPKSQIDRKIPVFADIGVYNEWHVKHRLYDPRYDPEIEGAPTKESRKASLKSPRPVELISTNEYFLDLDKQTFIDSKNKEMFGYQILDILYQEHIRTLSLPFRLNRSIKRLFKKSYLRMVDVSGNFLLWCLQFIWEEDINPKLSMAERMRAPKWSDFVALPKAKVISLFGYATSKRIIGSFCLLMVTIVLVLCVLPLFFKFLSTLVGARIIYKNPILTTVAVFLCLFIWDTAFPLLIRALYVVNRKLWEWGLYHIRG